MKLGYFTLIDTSERYGPNRRTPNEALLAVAREAVLADEMGFNSVWLPEHHFGIFGCLPNTAEMLAYVAARTRRVQLAPAVVLLPCNHPLRVAEEYSLLDLLSEGRAVFSAGRGYDKREYDAFGVPFEKSAQLMREGLELIQAAWTQESFTFAGEFYRVPEPVSLQPRPVQQPHPPVYVASFSDASVQMAVDLGFNIIFAPFAAGMMWGSLKNAVDNFKSKAAAAGNPNARARCSYFFNVVETKEQERQTKERLLKYFHGLVPAFPRDAEKAPPNLRYFADIVRRLETMGIDDLSERSIIVGDREYCLEQLTRVKEAGIEEVILYFNFGEFPHEDTVAAMRRCEKYILPHFS